LAVLLIVSAVAVWGGCASRRADAVDSAKNSVTVGIEGDIDSFSPLFAEDAMAGEINDLRFPGLMSARFEAAKGELSFRPLLASSWEFENNRRDIRFHLRTDVSWSDGERVSAEDVQLSYELYADTAVASVRQPAVEGLRRTPAGAVDVRQALEVVDEHTIVFHFDHPYPGQLFDAGLPVLPAHIVKKFPRSGLRDQAAALALVGSGPFGLSAWKPMEEVRLEANASSALPHPARLHDLVFRVIPDYHARLMQLRTGEIDMMPFISVDDARDVLSRSPDIAICPMGERFYDALNWNNIDPAGFAASKGKTITPNRLFGSAKVRRALTMAINRKEIVETYLQAFGRECTGPVSPLFRWAYNDTIRPLPYDPPAASRLLAEAGWRSGGSDRVLRKGGDKFSFTILMPAGNPLRSAIAAIVQTQLAKVNIEVRIEQLERSAFWSRVVDKNYDACIAGFSVPLQMELDELWGGDLEKCRMNLPSFRNARVDEILAGAKRVEQESDYAPEWKEFQAILQQEQPCTFLYWMNDLVAVRKCVHGTDISTLGITHGAEEWSKADAGSGPTASLK
jgi:peptide/nickel transport system substrate-binding protein